MKLSDKLLIVCWLGGDEASGFEYAQLYRVLAAVKPATIRSAVKRLSDQGLLSKIVKNKAWWLQVTGKGERKLVEKFLVLRAVGEERASGEQSPADIDSSIMCTIVVYNIAEKERVARDMWRRYLGEQGFVRLRKGVYASLTDEAEAVTSKLTEVDWGRRIESEVMVFRAQVHNISASQLAERMYDMMELYSQYLLFVSQAEGVLRAWQGQKGKVDKLKVRSKLVEKYFELVELDPGLPRAAYTQEWRFAEATGYFRDLVREAV